MVTFILKLEHAKNLARPEESVPGYLVHLKGHSRVPEAVFETVVPDEPSMESWLARLLSCFASEQVFLSI